MVLFLICPLSVTLPQFKSLKPSVVKLWLSHLSSDFLVRHDAPWLAHHHPSPYVLPLQASDQSAQVISCLCPVQRLVEHLNTCTQEK